VPETPQQERGWQEWTTATDPKDLQRRIHFYFRRAHMQIGQEFVRLAKHGIRSGDYAANAPLTEALKGSALPLVDNADLLGSITYKPEAHHTVYIGIGPSKKVGARGRELHRVLHDGARIRVTWKMLVYMRARLAAMESSGSFKGRTKKAQKGHAAAIAGARRALSSGGKKSSKVGGYWIIPARPYILGPIGSNAFGDFVEDKHHEALELALLEPIADFKAKAAAARAAARAARPPKKKKRKTRKQRVQARARKFKRRVRRKVKRSGWRW